MAATNKPSRKKIKTRSSKEYFLIGRSADRISENKLPLLGANTSVCLAFKRIVTSYYSLEKPSI